MTKRDTEELVRESFNDILEAIINALNFVHDLTRQEFLADKKAIFAVVRCLEIISRKSRQIRRLNRDKNYDELPWREMIGMERKLNHVYQELNPEVLWQTIKDDLQGLETLIRSILGENVRNDLPKHKIKPSRLKLISDQQLELTPTFLSHDVTPYLLAISKLQELIDFFKKRPAQKISIKSITQNSPISVNLDGAAEATEVVRDIVVPWRREHAKSMAKLEQQEKILQIENAKAEIQEKHAKVQKEHFEAENIPEKNKVEIERMCLENEKLRLEIEEARINLALKILDKLSPQLSQELRLFYTMQFLKPLGVLTESSLHLLPEPEE